MSTDGSADLAFVNGDVYTVDAARTWAQAVGGPGRAHRRGRDGRERRRPHRHVDRGDRPRGTDAGAGVPGRPRPSGLQRDRDAPVRSQRAGVAGRVRGRGRGVRGGRARESRGSSAADGPWTCSPAGARRRRRSTAWCRTGRSSCRTATATARGSTRRRSRSPASRATRPTPRTAGSNATRRASRWARCTRGRYRSSTPLVPPLSPDLDPPRPPPRAGVPALARHHRVAGRDRRDGHGGGRGRFGAYLAAAALGRRSPPGSSARSGGIGIAGSSRSTISSRSANAAGAGRFRATSREDHARRCLRELHRRRPRALPRRGRAPRPTNRGISFVDPELLKDAVTRLDALGFQVHFHAIGGAGGPGGPRRRSRRRGPRTG